MTKIKIFRFEPEKDEVPRYESYEVPEGSGIMVLDALNHIRENHEPRLGYRHSCHMGKCGSCAVTIDGKPGLACWEPVRDNMVVEPLNGFPVVTDLVVDRTEKEGFAEHSESAKKQPIAETFCGTVEKLKVENREMLDEVRKCIGCNSCVSVCPYVYTEKSGFFGPKALVETARKAYDPRLDETQSPKVALKQGAWDCVACRACVEVCPQKIDARQRIVDLRAMMIEHPELKTIPANTMKLNELILKSGRPYSLRAGRPGQWSEGLGLTEFSEKMYSDYLYFPGCTLNNDAAGRETAKGIAGILKAGGVDFGVAGRREICCGDPARSTGEKDLYELIKEKNLELFDVCRIHKIVTSCPHGMNAFKNDYGANDVQTYHYVELFASLIRNGTLTFSKTFRKKTTYHDPCYLGRYNRIYREPRFVLESVPGLELVEMENNGERSLCCGGGGGGAFIETDAEPRLSRIRAEQAKATGAEVLAVACPFCFTMLDDAVKSANLDIEVRHISDIVGQAL